MTKETRLYLGRIWKERLENPSNEFPVPKQVTKDHPHIKEYEDSIAPAEEPAEEPVSEEIPPEEPEA